MNVLEKHMKKEWEAFYWFFVNFFSGTLVTLYDTHVSMTKISEVHLFLTKIIIILINIIKFNIKNILI